MSANALRDGLGRLNIAVAAAKAASWGGAKDAITAAAAAGACLLSDLVVAAIQRERDGEALAVELVRLSAEVECLRETLAQFNQVEA
jgi:hypothetical protein